MEVLSLLSGLLPFIRFGSDMKNKGKGFVLAAKDWVDTVRRQVLCLSKVNPLAGFTPSVNRFGSLTRFYFRAIVSNESIFSNCLSQKPYKILTLKMK
jgi:hypothetical protein